MIPIIVFLKQIVCTGYSAHRCYRSEWDPYKTQQLRLLPGTPLSVVNCMASFNLEVEKPGTMGGFEKRRLKRFFENRHKKWGPRIQIYVISVIGAKTKIHRSMSWH